MTRTSVRRQRDRRVQRSKRERFPQTERAVTIFYQLPDRDRDR